MRKFFSFLILTALFIGCASKVMVAPSWYVKSPHNDKYTLYGVGEGRSKEEAKQNAMNDLASRLNFEIDAMMYRQKIFRNSRLSSELSKKIELNSQNINFFNAEIDKSSKIESKFYILVEVDRDDLANSIRDDLQLLESKIYSELDISSDSKAHKRLLLLSGVIETFQIIIHKSKILKILDSKFNLNRLKEIETKVDKIKRSVSFYIDTTPQNSSYAKEIETCIVESGYSLNESKKGLFINVLVDNYNYLQKGWVNQDKNRVTHLKYSKEGWQVYKNRVSVSLKDRRKIISKQTIEAVGSSKEKKGAYRDSVRDFVKKFDLNRLIYGG